MTDWLEKEHEVVHLVQVQIVAMHVPPADYGREFAQTPVFDVIKRRLVTDSSDLDEAEKAFDKVFAAYDEAILK